MADCTYPKCKDAAGCKGACRDLMGEVRRATDAAAIIRDLMRERLGEGEQQ